MVRKYSDFLLFKTSFSKYSPPISIHFWPFSWSFCIPTANHEVDLLLRYSLQLKSKLPWSLIFPASLFSVLETNKSCWGARSGLYNGWDNNCHLQELISSTVDEAV